MRWPIIGILLAALAGCASFNRVTPDPTGDAATTQTPPPLTDLGPAPELANEIWLNSEIPLRLADLRGKVVLLDMWTFG